MVDFSGSFQIRQEIYWDVWDYLYTNQPNKYPLILGRDNLFMTDINRIWGLMDGYRYSEEWT